MEFRIPQLQVGLSLEPSLADEQTVYDTSSVFLAPCFLGCLDHRRGNYTAVRCGDAAFFQFTWDDSFDLVLETEGDFGNFFRCNGGGYFVFVSR